MDYVIHFSCDKTSFDLTKLKKELPNGDLTHNRNFTVTNLEFKDSIFNNALYIVSGACVDSNNIVHISSNANGRIEGYIDRKNTDKVTQIFPHIPFNNFNITKITFTDWEDGGRYYEYINEQEFVLNLMLGRITDVLPFTEEWVNFYKKIKHIADPYMMSLHTHAEQYMNSLIDNRENNGHFI